MKREGNRQAIITRLWIVLTLAVALVPNVMLYITDSGTIGWRIANILVPAGLWLLLISLSSRLGKTMLLLIPIYVLNAWEIVLIRLYCGGVIAVDMFLNVATTNGSEVAELLGNLWPPIIVDILLYLPVIVGGVILCCQSVRIDRGTMKVGRIAGIVMMITGGILMVVLSVSPMEIWPVNAIENLCIAVDRECRMKHYKETSKDFTYHTVTTHPDDVPEIYVFVVGETSRGDHWQLNGYGRETNPRLSKRERLVSFHDALSQSNTTHKSVPLMLSPLTASNYSDSINSVKSIITAFAEGGYETAFLSNQMPNHSYIDLFASEADTVCYVRQKPGATGYDTDLLGPLESQLREGGNKIFIVIHTYGSHFNYRDRYREHRFIPDEYPSASREYRTELINAYDNTIVATDALLDSIISLVDKEAKRRHGFAAVGYAADHGEDIFDDPTGQRFLHASPTPTLHQLMVPMVFWVNETLDRHDPTILKRLEDASDKRVSPSSLLFPIITGVAGLEVENIVINQPSQTLYLDDHNKAVPLCVTF